MRRTRRTSWVGQLIEKLEKEKLKGKGDADLNLREERSDSDSDDDDERWSREAAQKRIDDFEMKFKKREELLKGFTEAGEKLAELDHTFGRKGKLLEEEIRDIAEERNSLTEKKRRPLYRKAYEKCFQNLHYVE